MATENHDHDDLDVLLRSAMKTLDDQVPSGYFDGLSNQVLARLSNTEDSMLTTTTGTKAQADLAMGLDMTSDNENRADTELENPDSAEATDSVPRVEDSGLHDIRSLAQSTKQRMSKEMAVPSTRADDDLIASSSTGWKAVALPEPAKMISLPDLVEVPSKKEIKAAAKAAKQRDSKEVIAPVAAAAAAVSDEPALIGSPHGPAGSVASLDDKRAEKKAAVAAPVIGARMAAQKTGGNKTGMYIGIAGLGLAAAAGIVFFVTRDPGKTATPDTTKVSSITPLELSKAQTLPDKPVAPAAEPKTEEPAKAEVPADTAPVAATGAAAPEPKKGAASKADAKVTKNGGPTFTKEEDKPDTVTVKAPGKTVAGAGAGSGSAGDPSFDDLLNEAGVDKTKKVEKPKLEKKSLSSDDIKHGMGGIDGKAKGCYAGTQGSAVVKLTVTPDGKVQKVSVSGAFANTPVGECVANAVRGASFPPWDGGPQSFGYNFLLSE